MGYEPSLLKTLQVVALMIHPNTVIRGLFQTAGAIVASVRHGGHLPRPETFESAVVYCPPFDGEWTVVNGSSDTVFAFVVPGAPAVCLRFRHH